MNQTEALIAKFIQYRKVYEQIGCEEISQKELLQYTEMDPLELEPILIKKSDCYVIDFETLSAALYDFYEVFLPGIFTYERLLHLSQKYLHGKLLYDADEVELDKQSYKYLYENLLKEHADLNMEFHTQRFSLDECQRELASLNIELQNLKDSTTMYADTTQSLMRFIRDLMDKDILVSSVNAIDNSNGEKIQMPADKRPVISLDDISVCPGIYEFRRPSWFTQLRTELSKENVSRKTVKDTAPLLKKIFSFWENIGEKELSIKEKADIVDHKRKASIIELINDKSISNEEKYIKYMLLTPGMSKDYMKTLNGASELGLNADIVIRLLEQPKESFNKEIIEAYVSKVHKALEYNLKQELADELIQGVWSIRGNINGIEEVFQLVPYGKLQELADQFEKVYAALEKRNGSCEHSDTSEQGNFDQMWENELNRSGNIQDRIDDTVEENIESPEEEFSGFEKEAF